MASSTLAISLAWLLMTSAGQAQATPSMSPRERFAVGVAAFESGRPADALDAFRDAYRMHPHPSVLINIANCYVQLHRPLDAALYFERYLRDAAEGLSTDERAAITQALGQARVDIATLGIEGPPGTSVFIDGDRTGTLPMPRAVEMNPGPHVVELRNPSGETESHRLRLIAGSSQHLTVGQPTPVTGSTRPVDRVERVEPGTRSLPAESASDRDDVSRDSPSNHPSSNVYDSVLSDTSHSSPSSLSVATWVSAGVAITTLAMGLGFGIKALKRKHEFNRVVDLATGASAGSDLYASLERDGQTLHDAQHSSAVIADVMLAVGLGAAGLSAYFYATHDRHPDERTSLQPHLSASASPNGGMVALEGRF